MSHTEIRKSYLYNINIKLVPRFFFQNKIIRLLISKSCHYG